MDGSTIHLHDSFAPRGTAVLGQRRPSPYAAVRGGSAELSGPADDDAGVQRRGRALNAGVLARRDSSDDAAVRWAATFCATQDDIHVIEPYCERAVAGCSWTPAVRSADAHRDAVRRHAAALARGLSGLGAQRLEVGYSAVQGTRAEVTEAFAECCDVLISGVPAEAQPSSVAIQAAYAVGATADGGLRAAVVLVPEEWRGRSAERSDAVVLVGSGPRAGSAAVRAAVAAAVRLDRTLCVLRDVAEPEDRTVAPREQAALADALAAGVDAHVDHVNRSLDDWLRAHRDDIALVVQDWTDGPAERSLRDSVAVTLGELATPTMLICSAWPLVQTS